MDTLRDIKTKMADFVAAHHRILEDFERSLQNARHFLNLAQRSMEHEPDNTEMMLEQIKEIDLLGHLGNQMEEFIAIAGGVLSGQTNLDDPGVLSGLGEVNSRYEGLMEEAAEQMDLMEKLLFTLQNHQ